MNKSEIFAKLFDALDKFRNENGHQEVPAGVYLTAEIENSFRGLTGDEIGNLSEAIFLNGVRKAVPTLNGFLILGWEAEQLHFSLKEVKGQTISDPPDLNQWKR